MKGSKETESIRYLLLIHLTNQIILFSVKSWALSRVSDPHREEEIWWWKEIKYSHEIIFQRVQLSLLFELNLKPLDGFSCLLVLSSELLNLLLWLPLEGGQGLVELRHLLWQVTSLKTGERGEAWWKMSDRMLRVNIWAGNSQNEIVYRFIIQEINWYFERFYSWDIHKFYWCIHGNLICTGRDAISPKRYEREELFSDCNFSWSHWQGYRAGSHCHCIVTRCFSEDNYSQFSNMKRDSQASPRVTHLYVMSVSLVFAKD